VPQLSSRQLATLRAVPVSDSMPNRVKAAAAIAAICQQDVVEGTGFAQPYVSDVFRGRYEKITVDNARRFAEFFGCTIEDLFPRIAA
jgi:predicted XRE-type DNA-binding protein